MNDLARQLDMDLLEVAATGARQVDASDFTFVKDPDQIDDRIHAAKMLDQLRLVMHVGLDHFHRGQQDQFLGHFATAGQHANLEAARSKLADEPGPDKSGAAENADAFDLHGEWLRRVPYIRRY